jgi:hypothetical protein
VNRVLVDHEVHQHTDNLKELFEENILFFLYLHFVKINQTKKSKSNKNTQTGMLSLRHLITLFKRYHSLLFKPQGPANTVINVEKKRKENITYKNSGTV